MTEQPSRRGWVDIFLNAAVIVVDVEAYYRRISVINFLLFKYMVHLTWKKRSHMENLKRRTSGKCFQILTSDSTTMNAFCVFLLFSYEHAINNYASCINHWKAKIEMSLTFKRRAFLSWAFVVLFSNVQNFERRKIPVGMDLPCSSPPKVNCFL